jgi:hypothetical protein
MRFRFPAPLHGWREFLGEVGIVVLGVLIALGASQLAEAWDWKSRVAVARQQLRYETGLNLYLLNLRLSQSACVDRRLDEIGAILAQAAKQGSLPPSGAIGFPPSEATWQTGVWQSQMSAQTAAHFPDVELASIGRVYGFIDSIRAQAEEEREAWVALSTLVGPGRQIDSAALDNLIRAAVRARRSNAAYSRLKLRLTGVLARSGLGNDFPQIDPHNPPIRTTASAATTCQPIAANAPTIFAPKGR